jgi:hypothetical protein
MFICGCAGKLVKHNATSQVQCLANLQAVALLLRTSIPTEPDYPKSLKELASLTTNNIIFVCPATGHKPADKANVEEWTDYIYIGNLPDVAQDPKVALLICPPENHDNRYGNVVWLTREVERMSTEKIRSLIITPWCFATNAPQNEIKNLKERTTIRVPKGLRSFYPNAYSSGGNWTGVKFQNLAGPAWEAINCYELEPMHKVNIINQ